MERNEIERFLNEAVEVYYQNENGDWVTIQGTLSNLDDDNATISGETGVVDIPIPNINRINII